MSIWLKIKFWFISIFSKKSLFDTKRSLDIPQIKRKNKIQMLFFEFFKCNSEYAQEVHNDIHVKDFAVIKIRPKTYYENISFWGVTFKNINLERVCFHNCKFNSCRFENVSTYAEKKLLDINDCIQGFSCCDFLSCIFTDCSLNQLFFSIGTLKCVEFNNTSMSSVIFQMNAFSQVKFVGNCKLHDFLILSPSCMFDIRFIENNGKIMINSRSGISNFKYKDMVNVNNPKIYKIFKKGHYEEVAATYYSFEQLLASNFLLDKKSDCYYQRKKAETRSKNFIQAIPGYLYEWLFGYGQRPFRALIALIITTIMYAPIYMLSGFNTGARIINYVLNADFFLSWSLPKIRDLFESVYFSFITLITIGQSTPHPINMITKIISSSELFIGAILVTTFTATLFNKITK